MARKNAKGKIDNNIVTIAVAVLGLTGTVITAYFGFRASSRPIEVIINATNTAEAQLTVSSPSQVNVNSKIQNLNERGLLSTTKGSLLWGIEDYPVNAIGSGGGYVASFPSDVQMNDFVLYGEFTVSANPDDSPYCGFIFRGDINGEGNFYITFLGLDKAVILWSHAGNEYGSLDLRTTAEAANDSRNIILLITQGNLFTFLVNDIVAYQATDDLFSSGRQGLVSGSSVNTNICTFVNAWLWKIEY